MNNKQPSRWKFAISLVLFQLAWFACVLGAAHDHVLAGMLVVAAVVGVHCGLSSARNADIALIAIAVMMGFVWDSLMTRYGVISYASPQPSPFWAPPWILALWALFATLLREPLRWLHGRVVLAAILGAIGGPLSYLSAIRLGAGHFPDTTLAIVALAAGWAVMTSALTEAARRLDRRANSVAVGRNLYVED